MSPAGIILAAGASRRMGSPKALLTIGGETFLDRQIRLLSPHCSAIVIVTGVHTPEILLHLHAHPHPAVSQVTNPDPDRGMLSSLVCGLRAIPANAPAFLFTPVDLPNVLPSTVRTVAAQATRAPIVIPRVNGRRGHPVAVNTALIPEFFALPDTAAPRDVIHNHQQETLYVDVDDSGILFDVDTPADYAALAR